MSGTPTLTAAKLVRLLKKRGFVEVRQKGSHLHLMLEGRHGLVTVPMHGGDLKAGHAALDPPAGGAVDEGSLKVCVVVAHRGFRTATRRSGACFAAKAAKRASAGWARRASTVWKSAASSASVSVACTVRWQGRHSGAVSRLSGVVLQVPLDAGVLALDAAGP